MTKSDMSNLLFAILIFLYLIGQQARLKSILEESLH